MPTESRTRFDRTLSSVPRRLACVVWPEVDEGLDASEDRQGEERGVFAHGPGGGFASCGEEGHAAAASHLMCIDAVVTGVENLVRRRMLAEEMHDGFGVVTVTGACGRLGS